MPTYRYLEKVLRVVSTLETRQWQAGERVDLEFLFSYVSEDEYQRRSSEAWDRIRQLRKGLTEPQPETPPSQSSESDAPRPEHVRWFGPEDFRGDPYGDCGFMVSKASGEKVILVGLMGRDQTMHLEFPKGEQVYFVQFAWRCSGGEDLNPPLILIDLRDRHGAWFIANEPADDSVSLLNFQYAGQKDLRLLMPTEIVNLQDLAPSWPEFQMNALEAFDGKALHPIAISDLRRRIAQELWLSGLPVPHPFDAEAAVTALLNTRLADRPVLGIRAEPWLAAWLFTPALLLFAFSLWHRVRRLPPTRSVTDEPWLLIAPRGRIELIAAVSWGIALIGAPLIALWPLIEIQEVSIPSWKVLKLALKVGVSERSLNEGLSILWRFAGVYPHLGVFVTQSLAALNLAFTFDALRRIWKLNQHLSTSEPEVESSAPSEDASSPPVIESPDQD